MSTFVIDPRKTVLCIGHLTPERTHDSMTAFEELPGRYEERLHTIFTTLSTQGYNTYLATSWDRFTGLVLFNLHRCRAELIRKHRLEFIFSMGIIEVNRPEATSLSHVGFFDEVIVPQLDDPDMTSDELFDAVLAEVSAVLYGNTEDDPFVRSIIDKAVALGKRMIDINANGD